MINEDIVIAEVAVIKHIFKFESYEKAQQRFNEPVIMLCDERGYLGRVSMDQMRDAGIVPQDLRGIAVLGMSLDDAIDAVTQREPNEVVVAALGALVAGQHSFPLLFYQHGLSIVPMRLVQR